MGLGMRQANRPPICALGRPPPRQRPHLLPASGPARRFPALRAGSAERARATRLFQPRTQLASLPTSPSPSPQPPSSPTRRLVNDPLCEGNVWITVERLQARITHLEADAAGSGLILSEKITPFNTVGEMWVFKKA